MTVLAAVRLMPRPPDKCEAILEINPSVSALVTRSSGQYEDENILLLVELINQELSLLDWSLSIKAEIPGNNKLSNRYQKEDCNKSSWYSFDHLQHFII